LIVTGVQTCALPISPVGPFVGSRTRPPNPRHRRGRRGYRRGSSDEDLGAAPASERARSNKRLKLTGPAFSGNVGLFAAALAVRGKAPCARQRSPRSLSAIR